MTTDQDLCERIETMLAQAAGFASSDPTEARSRARHAVALIAAQGPRPVTARDALSALERRAERELARYEALRAKWTAEIDARAAAWQAREMTELRAPVGKHR